MRKGLLKNNNFCQFSGLPFNMISHNQSLQNICDSLYYITYFGSKYRNKICSIIVKVKCNC
jgi:hypothetical protein